RALRLRQPPVAPLFPYTTLFRSLGALDVISKDSLNRVELSKVMASIHIAQKVKAAAEEPMTDNKLTYGPETPLPEIRPREVTARSEEHTSELQSRENLVCRLLLE